MSIRAPSIPIHNGHVDVIRRATLLVDKLIVAVAINAGKDPLFSLEERVRMVEADLNALNAGNAMNGAVVEVLPFETLLMRFAADQGADLVIRGLRAVSDFEYEFQMALNNKRLHPEARDRLLDGVGERPVHLLALRQGDRSSGRRRVEHGVASRPGAARPQAPRPLSPRIRRRRSLTNSSAVRSSVMSRLT